MVDNIETLVECKGKMIKKGRELFNKCLPEDYKLIDEHIDKTKLMDILNDIVLKYEPKIVIEILDKIKALGFTTASLEGFSLSIDELYKEELDELLNKLTGNIQTDMEFLKSDEVTNKLQTFEATEYVNSGARGSMDQLKQLVLSRGYVSDMTGKIRPNLIKNNLVKGLTQREFFDSSYGARKGLLDTALSTGGSGYLTRQLIYSTVGAQLGTTELDEDCQTTDYLEIKIYNKNVAKSVLWRWYLNEKTNKLEKIITSNYLSLVGQTIKLRSPIYCKNEKICRKCYGDLYKILHSDQVGIIATQAIGERITQLVLRTFHLSGVAQAQTQYKKQEDIIGGMQIAGKLFHKPYDINKLDGSGDKISTPMDLVDSIFRLFNPYKEIRLIHYEVIVSMMMWNEEDLWRTQKNRKINEFSWMSILKIPEMKSWLLGCAFANLKTKLLDGIIRDRKDENTCISDLFKY
jgi:DNA-directed RNA polymerase subunit beta'